MEHRDFIRGKKDGKIARVIKNSGGCAVRVDDDRSMRTTTVTIENQDARVLDGVSLVEEEMPAELSFQLPERYHKQAIGVGGKRIQTIMRRREAYVKFASSEEINRNGGFDVGDVGDNVIVRTPARNAKNLELVRRDIEAAVGWTDVPGAPSQSFVHQEMGMATQFHRRVLARTCLFEDTYPGDEPIDAISELEERTGVRIKFPICESGSDQVVLEGPHRGVEVASLVLQSLVPSLTTFITQDAIGEFKDKVKDCEVRIFKPVVEEGSRVECRVFIEGDSPSSMESGARMVGQWLSDQGVQFQKLLHVNAKPFDSQIHKPMVDQVQRERETREREMMLRAAGELQNLQYRDDDLEPMTPITPSLSSLDTSWKSNLGRSRSLATEPGQKSVPASPNRPGYAAVAAGLSPPSPTSPRSQGLNRSYSTGPRTSVQPTSVKNNLGLTTKPIRGASPGQMREDLEDELLGFDESQPDALETLLKRLQLIKYLPNFIEQEVDFPTFMTLSDADLRELGVGTFGARKKLSSAITELRKKRRSRVSPTLDVADLTMTGTKDDSGYVE